MIEIIFNLGMIHIINKSVRVRVRVRVRVSIYINIYVNNLLKRKNLSY